ncbi:hypothetical protein BofuT4_P090700.1 [Botrytis cinerea T4]|uniref:Uncharacterized protein n=1 Tax=Botryotinia fuckeliana (strain T4) TaxID=999810 RepID=G2YEZ0_BOTF4|nr:hypothetical protein BofuT4_P090700.1 [Botrytis cinerea T4]
MFGPGPINLLTTHTYIHAWNSPFSILRSLLSVFGLRTLHGVSMEYLSIYCGWMDGWMDE